MGDILLTIEKDEEGLLKVKIKLDGPAWGQRDVSWEASEQLKKRILKELKNHYGSTIHEGWEYEPDLTIGRLMVLIKSRIKGADLKNK